jgi:AGZA family xanthine/uracil permease-like MFS transporter
MCKKKDQINESELKMKNIKLYLENRFEFKKYGTNWRTEILAGLATYLSLAYIFIVNPAILTTGTGMNISAVLFATIIASGFTTIAMGWWARLPFCVAPGLEMDGFFAFIVVGTLGLTWQQALGAVFFSGLLCIFFTLGFIRQKIVDSIPYGLKKAMALAVGIFVMVIGLYLAGIVKFDNGIINFHASGIHFSAKEIALLIGLTISLVLMMPKLKFPAGMLIAIIIATIFCKSQGIEQQAPAKLSSEMFSGVLQLDIIPHAIKTIPILLVFFLIDFYGGIGKFIGLTASTNLVDKEGNLARIDKAMYVDGFGTTLSGLVGTSSVITYVESAVGISMGGRTGIVAIVCGLLMLCSLAFTPLVGLVPVEATAGVLVYVGGLLIVNTYKEKLLRNQDFIVMAVMILITCITFNLGEAMAFGFFAYSIIHIRSVVSGKMKPNWYLLFSTVAIVLSQVSQYWLK